MEGPYTITIKFAGRDIPKSPFSVGVQGFAGDPSKVTASGPGLEKTGVMVKKRTHFEVFTKSELHFFVTESIELLNINFVGLLSV
jgi:filamin